MESSIDQTNNNNANNHQNQEMISLLTAPLSSSSSSIESSLMLVSSKDGRKMNKGRDHRQSYDIGCKMQCIQLKESGRSIHEIASMMKIPKPSIEKWVGREKAKIMFKAATKEAERCLHQNLREVLYPESTPSVASIGNEIYTNNCVTNVGIDPGHSVSASNYLSYGGDSASSAGLGSDVAAPTTTASSSSSSISTITSPSYNRLIDSSDAINIAISHEGDNEDSVQALLQLHCSKGSISQSANEGSASSVDPNPASIQIQKISAMELPISTQRAFSTNSNSLRQAQVPLILPRSTIRKRQRFAISSDRMSEYPVSVSSSILPAAKLGSRVTILRAGEDEGESSEDDSVILQVLKGKKL